MISDEKLQDLIRIYTRYQELKVKRERDILEIHK